jgi:hypothetical protein
MPRVPPTVRSTRYVHAINTLVAKRAEIVGLIRFKVPTWLTSADMALSRFSGVFEPDDLALLQRASDRLCKERRPCTQMWGGPEPLLV